MSLPISSGDPRAPSLASLARRPRVLGSDTPWDNGCRLTEIEPTAASPSLPRFAEFVAMMAGLMALTALSIDIMLPALPQMREDFGLADPNRAAAGRHQLRARLRGRADLPRAAVGLARAQAGAARPGSRSTRSPRFGCLVAGSFEVLLLARASLQGAANAAPRVIAIAVVRDVYGGRRMAEVMSFVMMVFIIVPVLAPGIGSAVPARRELAPDLRRSCSRSALALFAWMALRLPETHAGGEPDRCRSAGWRRRSPRPSPPARRWATRWRPGCSSGR